MGAICSEVIRRAVRYVGEYRLFIPAMIVLGLLVRAAWVAWIVGAGIVPASDAAWYHQRAIAMAAGAGYTVDGVPTAYWPVGYPAFLAWLTALFGPSHLVGMVANVILYGGVLYLAYALARTLFGSELIGRMTLLLLALCPNQIAYSSLLMSETLFLLLVLGGMALLLRAFRQPGMVAALGAGCLFGAASLVKFQAIFLPVAAVLILRSSAYRRIRWGLFWRNVVAVHLVMGLVLFPWLARNDDLFGRFGIISNNGGINLLIGNNPEATGAYHMSGRIEALYNEAGNEAEQDAQAMRVALGYIAAHPVDVLELLPRKFWYLYRADTEGFSLNGVGLPEGNEGGRRTIFILKIIAQLWYVMLGAACIGYAAMIFRRESGSVRWPGLGLIVMLYFTAISLIFFGDGRFHFPALPWAVMYAAACITMLCGDGAVPMQQVHARRLS